MGVIPRALSSLQETWVGSLGGIRLVPGALWGLTSLSTSPGGWPSTWTMARKQASAPPTLSLTCAASSHLLSVRTAICTWHCLSLVLPFFWLQVARSSIWYKLPLASHSTCYILYTETLKFSFGAVSLNPYAQLTGIPSLQPPYQPPPSTQP